jgi:hypothetical protein
MLDLPKFLAWNRAPSMCVDTIEFMSSRWPIRHMAKLSGMEDAS